MTDYLIRISLYTILPVLLPSAAILLDPVIQTRQQRLELFLIFLFGLGVAGSGIANAFGHLFLSDLVATSIGWETGSPFQLEMGFANLAFGVLGLIAVGRRDGFREAAVIGVTVMSLGATAVHLIDIAETGNLAPGNTLQNVINILKPAFLIGFLIASRRAGRDSGFTGAERAPYLVGVGLITGFSAGGFAVGYAIDFPIVGTALGLLLGLGGCVALVRMRREARAR